MTDEELAKALRWKAGAYAKQAADRIKALTEQLEAAERERDEVRARVAELEAALTPNGETKAYYIGEFSFDCPTGFDADGNEIITRISVPWTTIKEIMAAIRARATLAKGAKK